MNNDILQSEEFYAILDMNKKYGGIVALEKLQSFIRQHFTPKTVEENTEQILNRNAILSEFLQWYNEHHPENHIPNSRLGNYLQECHPIESPPLTKGGEEKEDFYLLESLDIIPSDAYMAMPDIYIFLGTQAECEAIKARIEFMEESAATPNMDNYRAELLTVATAAMQAITTGLYSQDEATSIIQNHKYAKRFGEDILLCDIVAFEAVETAKSLITAIDKEVKSNPASE
jgi:hypothetical protein